MPIISLKYTSDANNQVQVITDQSTYVTGWPCHTWHAEAINEAIAGGLAIEPFQTAAEALATAQDQVWAAIKAKRDGLKFDGGVKVAVDGVDKWFYVTVDARTQYANLAATFTRNPTLTIEGWRTMDGSFVTMDAALLGDIQDNCAIQESTIFAVGVTHETAMMALTTAADVLAYDFSTGWPAVYGD